MRDERALEAHIPPPGLEPGSLVRAEYPNQLDYSGSWAMPPREPTSRHPSRLALSTAASARLGPTPVRTEYPNQLDKSGVASPRDDGHGLLVAVAVLVQMPASVF